MPSSTVVYFVYMFSILFPIFATRTSFYSLFDIAPSPKSSLRVVFVKKLLLIFGSCDKEISGLLLATGSRVCRVSESGVKDAEPGFKNRLAFSIIAANDNNNNRTS